MDRIRQATKGMGIEEIMRLMVQVVEELPEADINALYHITEGKWQVVLNRSEAFRLCLEPTEQTERLIHEQDVLEC